MKKLIVVIFVFSILSSCSLLDRNLCGTHISDNTSFRANAQAISTNIQFAQDKSLFLAKKDIAIEVDNYILNNYNHQTFLEDPNYENKITIARKTILSDISVVCSKTIPKRDVYKSFVAIEITKASIDKEINKQLTNEIE